MSAIVKGLTFLNITLTPNYYAPFGVRVFNSNLIRTGIKIDLGADLPSLATARHTAFTNTSRVTPYRVIAC